ncbi:MULTISPECIES: hypothetical protein [unclassified Enterococcus]|uniref:hypothetical protein n=1 Tax=unclassified Enterococcus TaxID=2608891 RepID=UPI000A341C6E|nr:MULTISPECIES: hypothetical protein [unclassified Enterococcus]OTO76870.1 hypothetical protein A5865_000728 [Enterococcus sp. 12E11_DIV0728]OUZ16970.1 hypothetical protein A5868_001909 [Enterococcus sp. 12F9_DIV0723]
MELISTTLSTIKRHRLQFSLSWVICLVALFVLTSFSMLKLVLYQLDSSNQIQLFTTKEIDQLQRYFSDRLLISGLILFVLLLAFFGYRVHQQKKEPLPKKKIFYAIGLEFFIGLMIATICLVLLFTLFEPLYQMILQSFYHQALNQMKELPNFVLSNGTSGIAYSIRSSLSFELSSTTLLDLFFVSLFKAVSYIFLSLCVLILSFYLINTSFKKANVR